MGAQKGRGRAGGGAGGLGEAAAGAQGRGPEWGPQGRAGARPPLTVDSRTWLWKCCSRADTSSCASILRHARVRAPRRTIARRPEGLGGRRADQGPQRAAAAGQAPRPPPPPPPQKPPLGWRAGTARPGAARGRGYVRERRRATGERAGRLRT